MRNAAAVGVAALIVVALAREFVGDLSFLANREFWMTAFPAWLQGVGTVVAAYVGWQAFVNWRGQESAKRKADIAEKILRLTYTILDGIKDARSPVVIPNEMTDKDDSLRILMEIASNPDRLRHMESVAGSAGDLRSNRHLASLYFGSAAGLHIDAVLTARREIVGAMEVLARATRGEKLGMFDLFFTKESALEHLAQIGFHTKKEAFDDDRLDEFSRKLAKSVRDLEGIVAPHMNYGMEPVKKVG